MSDTDFTATFTFVSSRFRSAADLRPTGKIAAVKIPVPAVITSKRPSPTATALPTKRKEANLLFFKKLTIFWPVVKFWRSKEAKYLAIGVATIFPLSPLAT